jgi:protoporphyrin/coproporphyrin ferrochelatase
MTATRALVVMAYGTPRSPEEIEPYYTHIRRGRPPTPEQLDELRGRYEAIGGVSPLAARTARQAEAIGEALDAAGPGVWQVTRGNKHVAPFLEDAVAEAAKAAPEVIVGLVMAPHWSKASVAEYHGRAAEVADQQGVPYVAIDDWSAEPAWLDAQATRVGDALAALPARTEVLFTAHSLPERVLAGDPYAARLEASATAIAERAGLDDAHPWSLAWQSAGRTPEPWRGPDVGDVLRDLGKRDDVDGVLVCPQGFVSDHLEVLYDVDIEAAAIAAEAGMAFARTASVNDDPAVMQALAERVRRAGAG